MMLKPDTRLGWGPVGVRLSYVTHFCNAANMINIEDTCVQLLL